MHACDCDYCGYDPDYDTPPPDPEVPCTEGGAKHVERPYLSHEWNRRRCQACDPVVLHPLPAPSPCDECGWVDAHAEGCTYSLGQS